MIVQILFLALALSAAAPGGRVEGLQSGDFKAGASVVDITPEKWPVAVNGMFTERSATKASDRVHVRALVLDDGTTRVAIAVVDSCMVPRDLLDAAKEQAAKTTGIPTETMLVSSTHTHSAPSAMGCLGSDADPDYPAFLKPRLAQAIEKAAANLAPAQVGWAVTRAPEHTHCRRWITRPDKMRNDPFGVRNVRAMMHPGYQNPDYIAPSGPVDDGLTLLAVRTKEGKPLALLANFSMHYFGSPIVSADYYGLFCGKFAADISADASFVAIMSQGTSGDLMWMDYGKPKSSATLQSYTDGLVKIALEAYKAIEYRASVPIAMREAKLTLRRRVADEKRLAWSKDVMAKVVGRKVQSQQEIYAREQLLIAENPTAELKLQALRIGDLGVTAIPNEVYSITGLKLKAWSPLRPTMNLSLANGAEGYIPPPEHHQLGGYCTWSARTAGLEVQAEPQILETLLKLLEEVSGKPRRPFAEPDSPYAKAVKESKPAAYWRLGEMAGHEAFDSSGNGIKAALEPGFASFLEGPSLTGEAAPNRAVHLAGGRMRGSLPGVGSEFSVEFWFWNGLPSNARPVTGVLFSRGTSGETLAVAGTDVKEHQGKLFYAYGEKTHFGKTSMEPKTWYHVMIARKALEVLVLLNGEPEIFGNAPESAGVEFSFGGRPDGANSFEGKMDEVGIFDKYLRTPHYSAASR